MREKISLIIPYYEVDPEKRDVLAKCVNSMAGQYDELIVVDEKADNLSYKINKGLRRAKGDWLIVCNDDIELEKGTLRDLCVKKVVTCPLVNGNLLKLFHGHMFCMNRLVYAEVGPMFEGYKKFYFDDSDYWMQIEAKGFGIQTISKVNIKHEHPGRTIHKLNTGVNVEDENREIFLKRWGDQAYRRVTTIYS